MASECGQRREIIIPDLGFYEGLEYQEILPLDFIHRKNSIMDLRAACRMKVSASFNFTLPHRPATLRGNNTITSTCSRDCKVSYWQPDKLRNR